MNNKHVGTMIANLNTSAAVNKILTKLCPIFVSLFSRLLAPLIADAKIDTCPGAFWGGEVNFAPAMPHALKT